MGGSGNVGPGGNQTPYMKRKIMDQQEVGRRQLQQKMNQLPPLSQPGAPTGDGAAPKKRSGNGSNTQEKRFSQTLDSVQASRSAMERQGFAVGELGGAEADAPTQTETAQGSGNQ